MRHLLRGIEAFTLEASGSMPASRARRLVPASLPLDEAGGRVAVSLLAFEMSGLRLGGIPPGFDYGEALWRVAVRHDGAPAWFAVACDLDHPFVALVGARLVRYPVRAARLSFVATNDTDVSTRIEAATGRVVVLAARGTTSPTPEPPRPVLAAPDGERVYLIPWAEDPAPTRHAATVRFVDIGLSDATFGTSVEWSEHGLVHRGRGHRCGFALPVTPV